MYTSASINQLVNPKKVNQQQIWLVSIPAKCEELLLFFVIYESKPLFFITVIRIEQYVTLGSGILQWAFIHFLQFLDKNIGQKIQNIIGRFIDNEK